MDLVSREWALSTDPISKGCLVQRIERGGANLLLFRLLHTFIKGGRSCIVPQASGTGDHGHSQGFFY